MSKSSIVNTVKIGTTADGYPVFDRVNSHIHFGNGLDKDILIQGISSVFTDDKPFIKEIIDFGCIIGTTDNVMVTKDDDVKLYQRPGRKYPTLMVKNRDPEPCSCLTVILIKQKNRQAYTLITAFIGYGAMPEMWDKNMDEDELLASEIFWREHALIYNANCGNGDPIQNHVSITDSQITAMLDREEKREKLAKAISCLICGYNKREYILDMIAVLFKLYSMDYNNKEIAVRLFDSICFYTRKQNYLVSYYCYKILAHIASYHPNETWMTETISEYMAESTDESQATWNYYNRELCREVDAENDFLKAHFENEDEKSSLSGTFLLQII